MSRPFPSLRVWSAHETRGVFLVLRTARVPIQIYADIVSFPDPTLKEGKGLVYIEQFLGLVSEFCRAIQIHAIWFTCDNHVALRNSHLLLRVRAVDALPSMRRHASHMAPKGAGCIPDPFLADQPLHKRGRVWSTSPCCFVNVCHDFLGVNHK